MQYCEIFLIQILFDLCTLFSLDRFLAYQRSKYIQIHVKGLSKMFGLDSSSDQ